MPSHIPVEPGRPQKCCGQWYRETRKTTSRAIQKVMGTALDSQETALADPHTACTMRSRVRIPKTPKIMGKPMWVGKSVQPKSLVKACQAGSCTFEVLVITQHHRICQYPTPHPRPSHVRAVLRNAVTSGTERPVKRLPERFRR